MHDRVAVPLAGRLSNLRRVAPAIDVQSRGDSGAAMSNFLPYFQIIRSGLYAGRDLFAGFDVNAPASFGLTPKFPIYRQFVAGGGAISGGYLCTRMQSLHDNSIAQALRVWLANEKCAAPPGGHDLARTDPAYTQIAQRARPLASFKVAMRAPELIAKPAASVAVPAGWFGHDPGTPLATQIARYFKNSVREDGLVSIGTYGVMFAAGTAGTIQEIFQNTTNNYYHAFGVFTDSTGRGLGLIASSFIGATGAPIPGLQSQDQRKKLASFVSGAKAARGKRAH